MSALPPTSPARATVRSRWLTSEALNYRSVKVPRSPIATNAKASDSRHVLRSFSSLVLVAAIVLLAAVDPSS